VLRKLKRDYGVKVVATRERPGANLVINCDEYTSYESSICNRHLASHEVAYQPQPIAHGHVLAGEAMPAPMPEAPRRHQVHAFQHVEHVFQPTVETTHVYAAEPQGEGQAEGHAEGQQPAGDYARVASGGDDHGRQAQAGESEAHPAEQAGGAAPNENQSGEPEESGRPASQPAQQDEASDANAGQHAPATQPNRGQHQTYELGAGFDEQQQQKGAAEEQSWQQGATDGHEQSAQSQSTDWMQPTDGDSKQVEPAENYPAGQRTKS
jgi:hypothetical protein